MIINTFPLLLLIFFGKCVERNKSRYIYNSLNTGTVSNRREEGKRTTCGGGGGGRGGREGGLIRV